MPIFFSLIWPHLAHTCQILVVVCTSLHLHQLTLSSRILDCLWLTVVVDFSTSDFDRRQSVKTLLTPRSCNWKMEMEKG